MTLNVSFKEYWQLSKDAVKSWSEDRASRMGASLAYYTLFSLAPLLIIIIAVAGLVFGQEAAQGEVFQQLRGLVGNDGAAAIQGLVESSRGKESGILATVIGVFTLLLGATTVFAELKDSLDEIWDATPEKTSGVMGFLRTRVLSFGLILSLGFLLLVSLVVSAGISAFNRLWGGFLGAGWLFEVLNFVISFGFITLIFAIIYKWLPSRRIAWKDVWVGAAVTSLLFTIGKTLIGLYLGHSATASSFGAAGSLIVVVLWVYYSTQIFFLGAEFTKLFAHRHGTRQDKPLPEAPRAQVMRDRETATDGTADDAALSRPPAGAARGPGGALG